MSEKCVSVFFVGKKLSVEFNEIIKTELESTHIHEIPPGPFNRRGSLAMLIRQAKTVQVCVNRSDVSDSEIKIAIANKLRFHIADKTKTGKSEIIHSSEFASSNFN